MRCTVAILIAHSSIAQVVPDTYTDLEQSYEAGNFEACVKMESRVEALAQQRRDTLVANSFFYIGDAHYQIGETATAIRWFEREKALRADLGLVNTDAFSGSLYNLASLYLLEGQYNEAGAMADELIANDRKLYGPTSEEFVNSVVGTIDIYVRLDKFTEAEKLLQSTLRQQPRNSLAQGVLLGKLGDLYTLTSQHSKAEKALNSALDMIQAAAGEASPEYLTAATNLAILNMAQGKLAEAEEAFDYALAVLAPDEMAYQSVLNNQGLVYHGLGQLERAEKLFREIRAIDSASIGTDHPDFAITLTNLAFVLGDEGKYREAEELLNSALRIQRDNGAEHTASYARKLNNLARIYQLSGQPDKAIGLHEQALAVFRKALGKKSAEVATTHYHLGVAHWKAGDERTAIKHLRTSLSIRGNTLGKQHPKYTESLEKIAEYLWHRKQMKEARQTFGEVFNAHQQQINSLFPVLTEEEKAKLFYTNVKPAFEKFNSFALEIRDSEPAVLADLYSHQVNTKAAIMYATEKVKDAILRSGDTVLIHQFEDWQGLKERVARLYSQNAPVESISTLIESANVLEKELTRKSSVFAQQLVRQEIDWNDIRAALGKNEAAIEIIRFNKYLPESGGRFTDEVAYAFLIVTPTTTDHPDLILLENGEDLESKFLNYYRNSIRFTLDDTRSYGNYFSALTEYLRSNGITKAFLSPDGVYNQISINTLRNPETGNFVIDEFDIRLVTNTRELVEQTMIRSNSQSSALFGYPTFNLENLSSPANTTGTFTRGGNLTRGLRGGLLRYMRGEGGISVLPGTQVEIEQIARLSKEPETFLAERASEEHMKSVESPRILHVATHGYFLEDNDPSNNVAGGYVPNPLLKSGIILAGAENFLRNGLPVDAQGDDGILTAYEAMNLSLDKTELVVLSACETGLGVVKNGEGVYGLQRAFKIAGARSMIMSLWNVDDTATQELMSLFYAEKLKNDDQHAAFRSAQRKLKEKYSHPFYWGAFVMVGI